MRNSSSKLLASSIQSGKALSLIFLVTIGMCYQARPVLADWVWSPETNWLNSSDEIPENPESLLKATRKLFAEKEYAAATEGYQLFLNFYQSHKEMRKVLEELLEALFLDKQYEDSLELIEAILQLENDSATVLRVAKKKYEIGRIFLAGATRSFLGIRYSGAEFGVQILDEIVERFPRLAFSDDALYHVAVHYQTKNKILEAEHIYERLIEEYTRSNWKSSALFQIGVCAMSRLKGIKYDLAPLDKAETAFRRYREQFPGGDRRREVNQRIQEIAQMRAERNLNIGRFYLRMKQQDSAKHYFRRVITEYPQTPAAKEALKYLE